MQRIFNFKYPNEYIQRFAEVLELRRFLDEIQKRLLLGQGQSVSFGRFVLVGGFNGRQDTIRGIHTDVCLLYTSWASIMYTASLSNASKDLKEAAMIDGANLIQQIMTVEWPAIKAMVVRCV